MRAEETFYTVLKIELSNCTLEAEQVCLNYNVTLYYTGIKNADEAELRQLASEPVDLNVYNVSDFPLLSKVVARLVHILCGRIEERGISKRELSSQ